MRKLMTTICLVVTGFVLSGCCSIMVGSTQKIPVASFPVGAKVSTTDGTSVVTPGILTLKKDKAYILTAEYPGYRSSSVHLRRKWNNWLWIDLLWDWGIVTWPVDFLTSSAYELYPETVTFNLRKSRD